jgi:hypothetical protein
MAKSVFCLIDSERQAEWIVDQLRARGFSNNDISVLFPDNSGTRDFAHEQNTKAPEGAATGAALIGLGIPEYEAKQYEGKIKSGNILISVHVEDGDERDEAEQIFKDAGAHDISYTGESSVPKKERRAV